MASNPMEHALASTIATMVQALRIGEPYRARQIGVTTLAAYAYSVGESVDDLLAEADLGEIGGLSERLSDAATASA